MPFWTPLTCAAYHGHAGVQTLIDARAKINIHGDTYFPVELAISKKHTEILAVLIAADAGLHANI